MSDKDKLQKFMNFINEDAEWESLPTEEKLGRNVIYFMKKWGEAVKDNAIYRQENAQLEEENKSLRASLEDLQKAIEEIGSKEWVQGSSVKLICTNVIERLKARGHWVEVKK